MTRVRALAREAMWDAAIGSAIGVGLLAASKLAVITIF